MESAGPGSPLTFDYLSGELEFPHLKARFTNVRKGGPKEKRLRRIISLIPDTRKDEMIALRLENVYMYTPSDALYDAFSAFGEIGDFFRPTNTQIMMPTQYCFIRYMTEEAALAAMAAMDGKKFGGYSNGGIWNEAPITVKRAVQDSFFTQDTGYITNEALDSIKIENKTFDSSLPPTHYACKRADAIRHNDEVWTLKVTSIPSVITPEMLQKLFGAYGEISNIYMPMDLKTRRFRDFAFVRFLDKRCAMMAWKDLDDVNLGVGRNIRVEKSFPASYFNMDETPS
jgi:RNA recognition motif-containing protein